MAELKFDKNIFKVTMVERERGWGQRPMGVKYFDNEDEAIVFCKSWSDYSDPDCYFQATYDKVIERSE